MRPRAAIAAATALLVAAGLATPFAVAGSRADHASDVPFAPEWLADTGLFGADGKIAPGVRPFSPQYPLWTDGASKRRWVHLPAGALIDATHIDRWRFPLGTRFWKEFSFGGRRIETRLLWKASPTAWVAASYLWDADGTAARLVPESGARGVVDVAPGRRHAVPSRSDCAACHGASREPLGFNALQLSTDRDPDAIHGESLTEGMITLETLLREGRLSPQDETLLHSPPRIAASNPQTRTVLGYLSTNCGTCHDGSENISALVPSLRFSDVMQDGDAAARRLINHPARWQAPDRPDRATVLLDPDSPESSAILLRMRSRRPSSQMPPLGTVVPDRQAIDAVRAWIEGRAAASGR